MLCFDSNFIEICSWGMDGKSALGQVMAWHRTGNKPLPRSQMTQFTVAYVLLGLSELKLSILTG